MMWSLLVFALVGLLAGAAARLFYSERQFGRIAQTLALGLVAAVSGGAISWWQWPFEESRFHLGNLIVAFLAAVLVIGVSAGLGYAQELAAQRSQTPIQ